MIAVLRFRTDDPVFPDEVATAVAALATRPGFRSWRLGRATDDEALWVLVTEWDGVGSYRRALSAHEVRLAAVPLLSRALDEPGAFEVVQAG